MTIDEAKRMIEVFGPCTSMYECSTPQELLDRITNPNDLNDVAWIEYDLEKVFWEREFDYGDLSYGGVDRGEHERFMSELRDRITNEYGPRKGQR